MRFYHKDQSGIDERLAEILRKTEAQLGVDLGLTSGYRSKAYNASIGGAKESYHVHGTAADIDMAGMEEAVRAQLVNALRGNGATGFITYDKHPNMLHVDLRPKEHFMHNKSAANMRFAPDWFKKVAGLTLNSAPPNVPGPLLPPSAVGNEPIAPAAPAAPSFLKSLLSGDGKGVLSAMKAKSESGGVTDGLEMMGKAMGGAPEVSPITPATYGAGDDAGRMAAAQQLMSGILNKRRGVRGLSLMG